MGYSLLVLNTNRVRMFGCEIGGVYLDETVDTFEVTSILDANGDVVGGEDYPVAFTYEAGSNGEFYADISSTAEVTAGDFYVVVVDVADGVDRVGHWEIPAKASTRDGIAVP